MALGSSAQQEYSIMHLGEEVVGGESVGRESGKDVEVRQSQNENELLGYLGGSVG